VTKLKIINPLQLIYSGFSWWPGPVPAGNDFKKMYGQKLVLVELEGGKSWLMNLWSSATSTINSIPMLGVTNFQNAKVKTEENNGKRKEMILGLISEIGCSWTTEVRMGKRWDSRKFLYYASRWLIRLVGDERQWTNCRQDPARGKGLAIMKHQEEGPIFSMVSLKNWDRNRNVRMEKAAARPHTTVALEKMVLRICCWMRKKFIRVYV